MSADLATADIVGFVHLPSGDKNIFVRAVLNELMDNKWITDGKLPQSRS